MLRNSESKRADILKEGYFFSPEFTSQLVVILKQLTLVWQHSAPRTSDKLSNVEQGCDCFLKDPIAQGRMGGLSWLLEQTGSLSADHWSHWYARTGWIPPQGNLHPIQDTKWKKSQIQGVQTATALSLDRIEPESVPFPHSEPNKVQTLYCCHPLLLMNTSCLPKINIFYPET